MIRHCVMLSLRPDHDAAALADILRGLATLCDRLSGASGFKAGPNRDFEDKSRAYSTGFTIDFNDEAALRRYAENPDHHALGVRLVAQCRGGADGIMVFDLECA